MTAVDVIIVAFAVALAVLGYQHGLLVGAITLAGFVGGAIAGARLGPSLLEGGADSPYAGLTALLGGLLIGASIAALAETLARKLRTRLHGRGVDIVDGIGGALLLAALALALAWVTGIVALNTPGLGGVRGAVQNSTILAALNEALPPSGPILNVLHRVDPRPAIEGPDAKVERPNPASVGDPEVVAAAQSVVRVQGTACGLGVEGSGWVARPGVVLTNAHVVAGSDDTVVQTSDGAEFSATAIAYEPRNDLAVLSVPDLGADPLELPPNPESGAPGAIVGYPQNGPLDIVQARVGETVPVTSQDSYGAGPIRREMTPFRGDVRPGNSGGPVIGTDGRVLTTVFAASTGKGAPGGLGVPNSEASRLLASADSPVSTGPCTG